MDPWIWCNSQKSLMWFQIPTGNEPLKNHHLLSFGELSKNIQSSEKAIKITTSKDFPGSPEVKNLLSNAGDGGSIPAGEWRFHMLQKQLSSCPTMKIFKKYSPLFQIPIYTRLEFLTYLNHFKCKRLMQKQIYESMCFWRHLIKRFARLQNNATLFTLSSLFSPVKCYVR